MLERKSIPAGRKWGPLVAYSRAVRIGDVVEVSGTSATNQDGSVVAPGDAFLQTQYILREIARALSELGAAVDDVIRTRVYLTDIKQWEAVARAHREVFASALPASTFVEIRALMLPDLVVEVEATAIVASTHNSSPR